MFECGHCIGMRLLERFGRKIDRFVNANVAERFVMLCRASFNYLLWPLCFIVLAPTGVLALVLARAMEPLFRIRVGMLEYGRIGHLAANTEVYLRRQAMRTDRRREFHVLVSGPPANLQLLTMIRRRVPVTQNILVQRLSSSLRSRTAWSPVWIDLPMNTNEYFEFNNAPSQLSFTEEEKERGSALLAEIGVPPGQPFVCFLIRDKAYLDATFKHRSRESWSYHDFRDSDIRNCLPAVEALAAQGLWALRMGAVVERAVGSNHPRVIDYATRFRSDFGDIFLLGHCKFYLGDTSGPWIVASGLGVPVACANCVPMSVIPLTERDLSIPKRHWSVEKGRFLTFREIIESGADGWNKTHLYKEAGIEVIENTAEEVLALTLEMNSRLDGTWVGTDEDEVLQARYRALFPPGHRCYGFPSRIGAEFLRQNRELLD